MSCRKGSESPFTNYRFSFNFLQIYFLFRFWNSCIFEILKCNGIWSGLKSFKHKIPSEPNIQSISAFGSHYSGTEISIMSQVWNWIVTQQRMYIKSCDIFLRIDLYGSHAFYPECLPMFFNFGEDNNWSNRP